MNRRKKATQIFTKKAKKANAKNQISNKPRYISKADREKLALENAGSEVSEVATVSE